ncbi:peptide-methionine (S)-S-oxide reductase MsrA [Psychroflexus sp. CAK57W]|uniref:peptide-methionine (S)-S-oxide reductase MsrA n=1 Tax=Psychroflexus curvus TaxID=2873595 RepID=UPI001CCD8526|nr:peptide-methionine (S)-S-oxide reductase MsrA [Psychroflexus curvus]MBZ9626752.1 peptide-methionine (S)-S-oxide reductase MsrA [Psychroflexus curvus]MBZ9786527.1 peptide-methionine (S)-S-oxide reductase MsrA [Psychroflexus curvus]
MSDQNLELATFANGCFWCTEAVFQRIEGVEKVKSGFTGGNIKNPPYREVVMGRTGHAEAIQVSYNPEVVDYKTLLYVFFSTHDPTTLNRQGYDVGEQYRSEIFYHSESQKNCAVSVIKELESEEIFDDKIVTQLSQVSEFYTAEEEHQNFYNNFTENRYCQLVIEPKLTTLRKKFSHQLKS